MISTTAPLLTKEEIMKAFANFAERDINIAHFGNYLSECAAFDSSACWCAIGRIGVLRVKGADAATFLHNQLSTNVKHLSVGQGGYTTYNAPNGRMWASFFLWRAPDDENAPCFYAILSRSLAEAVKARLSKYVLRAKVILENVSEAFGAIGLCGAKTHEITSIIAENPLTLHEARHHQNAWALSLAKERALFLLPIGDISAFWEKGMAHAVPAGRNLWDRAMILAGIPEITAATAEKLIPQEANWDILGGLDFQKGCYTGQEIIARTRYLGRLKTRAFLARVESENPARDVAVGAPVYSPLFGEQSCGIVINAAPDENERGQILLVAVRIDAHDGDVFVSAPNGAKLMFLPMPYEMEAQP